LNCPPIVDGVNVVGEEVVVLGGGNSIGGAPLSHNGCAKVAGERPWDVAWRLSGGRRNEHLTGRPHISQRWRETGGRTLGQNMDRLG
jgi:hypothetical protein